MEKEQETGSPDTPTRLNEQIERAMALHSENRLAEAAALLDSAVATVRSDPLRKMMMLSPLLSRLGGLYIKLGNYPKALEVLNEGVSYIESHSGKADGDLLDFYNNIAAIHMGEGRYEEARQALMDVVKARRNAFPTDRLEVARALNNLSRACAGHGLLEEAQRHIDEAYAILRPRTEPGDPLLTGVLLNIAESHVEAGRLTPASYFYEVAIESAAKKPVENALEYGAAANGLARLYRKLMRQREGIELAKRAVSIRAKVLGEQNPEVGASLQTAGLLYWDLGLYSDAVTHLRAAYQVFLAAYGLGYSTTFHALLNMLSASRKVGPDQDTELDLRDMIRLTRDSKESGSTLFFRMLVDLAALLAAKHENEEARQTSREAARAFHALTTPITMELQSFCGELAELLFQIGDAPDAIAVLESGVRADDYLIGQVIATRDDAQRRRWLRHLSEGTARFMRAVIAHRLVDNEAAANAAFHFVANRKGLTAEAFLSHDDRALVQAQPELTLLVDWIHDLEGELADVQGAGVLKGADERLERVASLKRRLRTLSLKLEAHTKLEHQPRIPALANASQLAALIPKDAALVEFYAVRRSVDNEDETLRARRESLEFSGMEAWLPSEVPERYVAFVMRPTTPPSLRLFDLGDGAEIDSLVHSYLVVLNQGQEAVVPRDQRDELLLGSEEELSRALRQRVFDPLAPALEGCSTLIVAPDGALCRVPFAVLLEDGESGQRLIKRFTFGYLATGRVLLRQEDSLKGVSQPPLILGDPDYDLLKPGSAAMESKPAVGLMNFTFSRLKGTADETWQVSRLIGGRRLVGRKASEAVLRKCHSPAILHVATHGYYVRPFADGIMVLGDIRRFPTTFQTAGLRGHLLGYAENPLLRSGMALAGANAWGRNEPLPEDVGDGLISSVEVAHLDLKVTELVVLSACSTALGDITAGEGVAGLLQALRIAGARATAAALWQIPDESTVALVKMFYEKLMGEVNLTPMTALCEAQRHLLSLGKPAWQWGAFVCYEGLSPLLYRPTAAATSHVV